MPPWSSSSEVCWRVRCALWEILQILCLFFLSPDPHFSNPLLSLELKFSALAVMPPAEPGLPPAAVQVCGCQLCCSLCVAAEHSTPGREQPGTHQHHFQRKCWCWMSGVRALLSTSTSATNLYMVFGKSLTVYVSQMQKYLGAQCPILFFALVFVWGFFWGGTLFFDLGYFRNNFQITRYVTYLAVLLV